MSSRAENTPAVTETDDTLAPFFDRFEEAWEQGLNPRVEEFLPPGEIRLAVLQGLAHIDLERRLKAGEAIRVESYLERFPILTENHVAVLDLIAAEFTFRRRAEPTLTVDGYLLRFPEYECLLRERLLAVPWVPAAQEQPEAPQGYELLGELGRGGMGVVYKAKQRGLDRIVALKMVLAGGHAGPAEVARFRTEAEAIARLRHPNIVTVYEVGEHEGRPFFSLEWCQGGSLERKLAGNPLPPEKAAELVGVLAGAMQAAHQAQVIHRDLKPANILLAEDGTPKVSDFGLARKLDEAGQTQTGAVMGTPSYMAPEQAQGRKSVGPPADVYALGSILYETLTGRPPFKAATSYDTLAQVIDQEPVSPRRLNAKVPRDLETVCLKCLHKDPSRRYPSAAELADELRRWLAGEPIRARPEGLVRKLRRQMSRHRALVAVAVVVLLAAAITGAVLWRSGAERREEATLLRDFDALLAQFDASPECGKQLDQLLARIDWLSTARAASARQLMVQRLVAFIEEAIRKGSKWEPADAARVDAALRRLADLDAGRAQELRLARNQYYHDWQTVLDLHAPFDNVADAFGGKPGIRVADGKLWRTGQTADPRMLSRVNCDGNLDLEVVFDSSWESQTQVGLYLNAQPSLSTIGALTCAPDGKTLAVGLDNGSVELLDPDNGAVRRVLHGHKLPVTALAYAADSRTLVSGGRDGSIKVWDTERGEVRRTFQIDKGTVQSVALTRDGTTLAVGSERGGHVWDLDGPQTPRFRVPTFGGLPVTGVAFAPDGRTLFAVTHVVLRVLDVATGREKFWQNSNLAHALGSLAVSPDGNSVAVATPRSSGISLFDVSTRNRPRLVSSGPEHALGGITCLAYSGDGQALVSGFSYGPVLLWDTATWKVRSILEGLSNQVSALVLTPNGQAVVAVCGGRSLMRWDLGSSQSRLLRDGGNYALLLHTGARGGTFAEARKAAQPVYLQVWRQQMSQKYIALRAPSGPLRLWARREGDLLTIQVNQLPPLVLRDVRPHRPRGGFFGLNWSGGGLVRFRAQCQTLPPATSPLEHGDVRFDRGQYHEALALYRKQARLPGRTRAELESRHKAECLAGICLANLNRFDEAARQFERCFGEAGNPEELWPVVAGLQLSLLHIHRDRSGQALPILDELFRRAPLSTNSLLNSLLTFEAASAINSTLEGTWGQFILFDPRLVTRLENREQVRQLNLFSQSPRSQHASMLHFLWAYRLAGNKESARKMAQQFLSKQSSFKGDFTDRTRWWNIPGAMEECCWVIRTYGNPRKTLEAIDATLFEKPGVLRGPVSGETLWVLIERCRFQAALKEWEAAERTLDLLFASYRKLTLPHAPEAHEAFNTAALMQGLLRERRGDRAGADAAWKRALFPAWLATLTPAQRQEFEKYLKHPGAKHPGENGYTPNLVVSVLAGALTDAQVRMMETGITGEKSPHKLVLESLTGLASVRRKMWLSRQGRKMAWQIAFREISYPECERCLPLLEGAELIRQQALPGPLTDTQEELIQKVVEDVFRAYGAGQITLPWARNLIMAWQGRTDFLGWAGVAPHLDPSLRGPIAYVLGQRYRHFLGKSAEAQALFEIARHDSAATPTLHKLAQAALERP